MAKKSLAAGGLLLIVSLLLWARPTPGQYDQPGPVQLDANGEAWAQKTLKRLTLEEKVGQMLVVLARTQFFNQENSEYQRLLETIRKYHVGAIGLTVPVDSGFLQKAMPYEAAMLTNQLQRASDVPLLFAADFEYGLTMRLIGPTPFPYPMAFGASGDVAGAEEFGRIVAQESRAIGVQWNWFPTADVNSNPNNPIINTRSFSEDPQQVSEMVAAYIRGAHQGGMLVTAKHFPGHGDTSTDTHLGFASVSGDRARLDAVELPPFQAAIRAGVDVVMIAHVTVPALDANPDDVASTSPQIVTGLLKKEMGFEGLVVTDSLDMNGLMRLYQSGSGNPSGNAAVAAVKAGNDILLLPQSLDGAYNGLLEAVRRGEIPESRIDESVLKILRAKASLGLHKSRLVNIDRLTQVMARPASVAVGQQVAAEAVTLVRDNGALLPLRPSSVPVSIPAVPSPIPAAVLTGAETAPSDLVVVVFTDSIRGEPGRAFVRETLARAPNAKIFYVDPQIAGVLTEPILQAAAQAKTVLAPVYVVPVSGKAVQVGDELKNTVSLVGDADLLMRRLVDLAGKRLAVVALGNPYLAADYPGIQTYVCTFSNLPVSETAAVKALFGETPIRGRLPVTIPGVARRGEGIDFPPASTEASGSPQRN
jgi:beta-N-acetylhexosaminidase